MPRLLRGLVGPGHEAGDGASDAGAQDRGHYFDTLEERSTFRRTTTENASSLSIEQNPGDLPGFHASVVAHRFVRCSGSRESIHSLIRRSVCCHSAPSLRVNPMPKKAVGLESPIGSWLALKPTLRLRSFGNRMASSATITCSRRIGTSNWGWHRR